MEKERPEKPATEPARQSAYQFPCWWGGMGVSTEPPLIASLVKRLRAKVGPLAAQKKTGVPFMVKSGAELMQKLRESLDELDMAAPVVAQEIHPYEPISGENRRGEAVTTILVHVKATVRLCAPDGSFVECVGSGHGGSEDDKSGGKASTYAWKDAILKGLSVPEKDMPDTDNEATPIAARTGAGAKPLDLWAESIKNAKTVARLDQIKESMAKLPMDVQLALSPAWTARREELSK